MPFLIVESDRRSNTPPPFTPFIFPNTSDQYFYFDVVILFNVVEGSGNYVFENYTPPPRAPKAEIVSCVLWAFYRKRCRRKFKKFSFDCKLRGLMPFLMVESKRSPTPIIAPKTSDLHFYIAIFFNIVERSENYVFEDNNPLPPPKAFMTRL